jgi:hypothetical protein
MRNVTKSHRGDLQGADSDMQPPPRHSAPPHAILKCVPFPESIYLYSNAMLLISEDNIGIIEDVRL